VNTIFFMNKGGTMRMQKAGRPVGATTEARREKLNKVLNPIPLENSDGAPFMDNGLREALAEAGAGFAGNQDDALPPELTEFLVNNGLGGKPFSIILKQAAVGGDAGGSGAAAYVKAFNRTIPSIEFIARNYGPGDYMFVISWRGTNDQGDSKTLSEIIDFSVSDKYEAEYLEHMQERKIEAGRKRMERCWGMRQSPPIPRRGPWTTSRSTWKSTR
jgi:hypothetical protein